MAQHVILNYPDMTLADNGRRGREKDWSPRTKLFCVVACALASWAIVLTPLFLIR